MATCPFASCPVRLTRRPTGDVSAAYGARRRDDFGTHSDERYGMLVSTLVARHQGAYAATRLMNMAGFAIDAEAHRDRIKHLLERYHCVCDSSSRRCTPARKANPLRRVGL